MKGENEMNASHPCNADEALAGVVSLSAGDPDFTTTMANAFMYVQNLDDYGESLNSNAADIRKHRKQK